MGTFGIVLLFLIKLRDMALAHMERRLMVQFTKFHLQSKNWLEKVDYYEASRPSPDVRTTQAFF